MDILNQFWLDLICTALALVFVNAAIMGNFHTHRRGGGRIVIASTKSFLARFAFLVVAIALVGWIVVDLKRKLAPQ